MINLAFTSLIFPTYILLQSLIIIMVEHWIIFSLNQFRLSLRLDNNKIGILYYPEVIDPLFPLQTYGNPASI